MKASVSLAGQTLYLTAAKRLEEWWRIVSYFRKGIDNLKHIYLHFELICLGSS